MIDKRQRTVYGSMSVVWMGIIFYFSSIPDLHSALPSMYDFILRKLAHMTEYAILYTLLWKSCVGMRRQTAIAFVITILYALTDELHQAYVVARVGSPIDVMIDAFGVGIGYLIAQKLPALMRGASRK